MNVVISQSMLFPWVGMLEQISHSDIFIHYDDVQFSKGSFVNRVQLKTESGPEWLTVPLARVSLGQHIEDINIDYSRNWQDSHFALIERSLAQTPYYREATSLVESVYGNNHQTIAQLSRSSMLALARYFDLAPVKRFTDVSALGVDGRGSERVLSIVKKLGASTYITGLGARNYLDHESFDRNGISVEYMNYLCLPYSQPHGEFTPYVSALDLVANCGRDGRKYICSGTVKWRSFLNEQN